MARQAIAAPPATPPRYGLLVAANVVDDDETWEDGVLWAPEACSGGGADSVDCGGNAARTPDANPANSEADPFLVWAADECSTFGFRARDYEARARRMLEAVQSYQVANEFWLGAVAAADGLINTPLADAAADTVTDPGETGVSITNGIALLEMALATCGMGRRGMIHMSVQAFIHAANAQLIVQQGQQWVTPVGTIVVADAGYPGTGPNGEPVDTTQWAYATSMVQVRLSPAQLVPGSMAEAQAFGQAMDRTLNTVTLYADRLALVQWDQCCHFAAQLAIPGPATGGAS